MIKKSLLIFSAISILSCSNDGDNRTKKTDLKLVTGINLRQTLEDVPLQLGNPNIYVNNKFVIYPNPVNTSVNVSS